MRLLECILFYLGLPVLLWLTDARDFLLPVLWLGALFAWTMLRYGRGHQTEPSAASAPVIHRELAIVLGRFVLVALVLAGALYLYRPEFLFWLPRKSLRLWGLVVLLYPVLSVLPQTLVYRALFERRYAAAFSSPQVSLLVGTLLFCAAHIPFGNAWALAFTLPGGFLFLRTYRRTGALWLSTLEHALYGDLLFTIGWGVYLVNSGTQQLFLK